MQLVSVAVPYVVQAAAESLGGVAADGAVGQRDRAVVVQAAAVAVVGVAAGDRQSRDRRGDTPVDLEHPAEPAAADRHARRRARDRLGPARVAQLELAAGQRDRLRRAEDGRVEGDRLGAAERALARSIGLAQAQVCRRGRAGVVVVVVDGETGLASGQVADVDALPRVTPLADAVTV